MCYYLLALLTVKSVVDRQGVYLFAQTQQIELDLDAVQSLWLVLGRKILIVYEKKKKTNFPLNCSVVSEFLPRR